MGLMNNIREFFSGSKNSHATQVQANDEYEKSILATKIVNLVNEIKRINSFDSSIWNLSNISSYELERKNLDELQTINTSLQNRLAELHREKQQGNSTRDSLETSKWTGQKPQNMSEHDFDRFQRDDR